MFNWKMKATNAIYLEDANGQEGRPFKSRFLQAGLVKYDFGVCLLKKETIDKFVNTFIGTPLIIDHKDNLTEADRVGTINKIWFSAEDGWYWCSGVITDEEAIKLIENGYNVSCQYCITEYSENTEGKLHNANPYDKEILNGVFEHLAIVENPRYEDAFIAVNAYIACNEDENMDKKEDIEWITIRGTHIPIKEGQTKEEAVDEFLSKKGLTDKNKERIQQQKDKRHSDILNKELPELRDRLSQLITRRYKTKQEGANVSFLDKEIEKVETSIEELKKEATILREEREEYIKENQPKYSTTKEHQEKVQKAIKDDEKNPTDWQKWIKRRGMGVNPHYEVELKQVIKKAKENPNERQKLNIGKVSPKLEQEAEKRGFNLKGYTHDMDVSGVRHSIKEHGDEKKEALRGQIAITDEDYNKIPEIIYDYDEIDFTGKNKTGLETITYKKSFPDGTIAYVEEIRTGKKTLTINTMYKHKKTGNPRTSAKNSNPLSNASIYIIPHSKINFNPNVTINKAVNKYQKVYDYIRNTEGEPMDNETKTIFSQLMDALKARNEAEDEKEKEKAKEKQEETAANEDTDKRKLIDEVGGILKGKVDEEIWRTIIGKLEKVAYDKSEAGTADNGKSAKNEDTESKKDDELKKDKEAQNKCTNEDDTNYEKLYKELKDKVDKDAENQKAKNSLDDVVNKLYSSLTKEPEPNYISPQKGIELGEQIYGR